MTKALTDVIKREIEASGAGAIPFARFMQLALYHHVYGYYVSDRPKVGKAGDFFTSASVHPVFAETLADAVLDMWSCLPPKRPVLAEIGGGPGSLLWGMAARIREVSPETYRRMRLVSVEASPYHRELQREALAGFPGEVRWYASVEEAAEAEPVEGVIVSNEWLDALPVHLLERTEAGWREAGVSWNEAAGGFAEVWLPALTEEARQVLAEHPVAAETGMRIEVRPAMRGCAQAVSRMLERGFVITIDYGDLQEELYHPSRMRGTLMCYHRHQASDDPYVRVGEQDITAHVNFSHWIRWGEEAGLALLAYMRQDRFLIRCGLLEKAQQHADRDPFASEAMRRNRAILQLLDPAGLGGRFRVLVQGKRVPPGLPLRFLDAPGRPNSL